VHKKFNLRVQKFNLRVQKFNLRVQVKFRALLSQGFRGCHFI